jgi:hypothetical protein
MFHQPMLQQPMLQQSMFQSFYMAGFECATGVNQHRQWIDQVAATEHDRRVEADYALVAEAGIRTIRESVRWPLVDRGGRFDFTSLDPFLRAAREHRLEPIWDLFHYGYPSDVDPFGDELAARFARYCGAAARHICRALPGPHYFTPINEASYFAWAAGEVGRFAPHAIGRGHELKVCLARAAIAAIAAIRAACPQARIVTVDPICHVAPPVGASPAAREGAEHFNQHAVFQFMDMMAGRFMPELGGQRECLDLVGINYYWTNQWEVGLENVPLAASDPRHVPLAELVRRVARRYGGPVLITETAGAGDGRGAWIDELSSTATQLLAEGVPLVGICIYPVLGMPEWHERECWARMGLWDLARGPNGLERQPHGDSLAALRRAARALDPWQAPPASAIAGSKGVGTWLTGTE